MIMEKLIECLHAKGCSCVVGKDETMRCFFGKGIRDLLDMSADGNGLLQGAEVADKVVGKAAASLLVCGGVARVYADLMSEGALSMLRSNGIPFSYAQLVPYIKRRDMMGMCPMEQLTQDAPDAATAVCRIRDFLKQKKTAL
ncbi:MAG TPA: DUF1893 domain-containing protein [Prevotellaceae bacterium]|nr:DUF1893 domain-containing protein [Prevotellaceae bacterium]